MYAELSYFDGYHFQHVADWCEHLRVQRLRARARATIDRRHRSR